MNNTKRVTIKQIAKDTGLSPATVGRVFASPELVKQKTIELVKEASTRLGYQPSLAGKALRTGKSYDIAIMLPFDRQGPASSMGAAQYNLIAGFSSQLHSKGYNMKLLPYTDAKSMMDTFSSYLSTSRPDAFVISQLEPQDKRIIALSDAKIPTVTFGKSDLSFPLHSFDFDNYKFTLNAVENLISLGRKNITFVIVDDIYMHYIHQLEGFNEAKRRFGNQGVELEVIKCDVNDEGELNTDKLTHATKRSDAIITVSPHFLFQIKQIAQVLEISIGADILVCCGTATPYILQMLDIPIICYYQDFTLAGEILSNLAIELAENPHSELKTVTKDYAELELT